jgi:hypothetical protein
MLSSNELRQLLDYDPNTGQLTWIKKINKGTVLKSRAGTKQADGYRSVKLYGRKYLEHRLIWCWVHGDYPSQHLDHINHIRDDNRIINLREVTISENARNRFNAEGISRRVLIEISLRSNLEPSSCSFCIFSNTVLTVGLGAPSGPISV